MLVAAEEQILSVELTTAYKLSDDEAAAIVKQIEEASGQRVEAARTVDPDLIGGLVLKPARSRSTRASAPPRPTSQRPRARVYLVEGSMS